VNEKEMKKGESRSQKRKNPMKRSTFMGFFGHLLNSPSFNNLKMECDEDDANAAVLQTRVFNGTVKFEVY